MKHRKKLVLFTLFVTNLVDQPAPEITIDQGTLSGKISADGSFYEYIGIPYATADSSRRFQAPGPAPSWEGVYKAVDEIYSCPQNAYIGVIGTEDCLKINVYVPAKTRKPLPVMVFIHGGAFILGSGGKLIYGADFIVKKDVILVTFNYRLGALGFLCLRIKEAPGNAGLKDQIAALRWVKKNIAAFGGDPDNVTVFGESAGATSTSLLLASDATKGLFQRAIVQSGSSISNWAINRQPVWVASLLAKALGYNTEDPRELYKIFSKLNYKDLIAAKAKKPLDLFFDTQLLHLPCVEDDIPGVEPVITDLPYNIFTKKPKDVDVIYGTTSKEGLFLVAGETEESVDERNGRYLFASDLRFSSTNEAMELAKNVQKFYFGDDKISMKKILNISKLYTELYFEIPSILESEIIMNRIESKVYNYIFNYSGDRSFMKKRSGFVNETGACHGDDLFYLFDGYLLPFRVKSQDKKIIDLMTTLWTNFAKYGNPTSNTSDLPVRWIPSNKNSLNFLYIDMEPKMASMPNPNSYRLWKDIYSKYRKTDIR